MGYNSKNSCPRTFPYLEEPRIVDANMNNAIDDHGLYFDSDFLDFSHSNTMQPEQGPYTWGNTTSETVPNTTMVGPSSSSSPGSSLPDSSSSDSSKNEVKRSNSPGSSHPGEARNIENIFMMENTVDPRGIAICADPVDDPGNNPLSTTTDLDISNRAMERHFDFESAASTPSPYSDTKLSIPGSVPTTAANIPYRPTHITDYRRWQGPYHGNLQVRW